MIFIIFFGFSQIFLFNLLILDFFFYIFIYLLFIFFLHFYIYFLNFCKWNIFVFQLIPSLMSKLLANTLIQYPHLGCPGR